MRRNCKMSFFSDVLIHTAVISIADINSHCKRVLHEAILNKCTPNSHLNRTTMDHNHERELKSLDAKITDLSNALAKTSLDGGKALRELLKHIHNPGWTTPAEFAFSMLIIDEMQRQIKNIDTQIQGIQHAAEKVGVKEMAM